MADRSTRLTDTGELPTLSEDQIAALEATNGLIQFDRVGELIRNAVESGAPLRLQPSTVLELNRLAVAGLEPTAGSWRTVDVAIDGSLHAPPPWIEVAGHVEQMCEYISAHWTRASALHLAAYTMWKLNWIHPFVNGNGRTSRAVSYLLLCTKLGYEIPGEITIADQIVSDRSDYYSALDEADAAWRQGAIDVTKMEKLIRTYLASQLYEVVRRAESGES